MCGASKSSCGGDGEGMAFGFRPLQQGSVRLRRGRGWKRPAESAVDGGRRGSPRQARGRLFSCGRALRSRRTTFAQEERRSLRRSMFQRCRPARRLFYLLLAVIVATWSVPVSARGDLSGTKAGKAAPPAAKPAAAEPLPRAASPSPQTGPTLTSVVEVRGNDFGRGQANDRNLLGRFSTQGFSLARLARTQNYFLRLYDSSSPPKYSRYSPTDRPGASTRQSPTRNLPLDSA
jgi:hypothetical protein